MSNSNNPLSALGNTPKTKHYENCIDGLYGKFETPSGTVNYIQTKAKLGGDQSAHGKLIKQLVPAREALNIEEMDFNQLLQRDLDDHRIATKLIEYVINPPQNNLPGFFPPILAIILPFDEKQCPIDNFPASKTETIEDPEYGLSFSCENHESFFRAQYAINAETAEPLPIPLGVLRWNSSNTKLVVMDGQHRAMSLLAIERTLTNSWKEAGKGARYQPFYEEHIKKCLSASNRAPKDFNCGNIELPVTLCWFENKEDAKVTIKPHLAARKLFVDVNNNAKPPSESRLVLLSDTQLDNILARELLNRLRKEAKWRDSFPLYAVEYDNPEKNATSPKRWSVVTSLEILKDAVIRTVFGPPKIISDLNASLQGRAPQSKMDARLRKQLKISNLFPEEFHDDDKIIQRDSIGNFEFPINDSDKHKQILDSFYENWGEGILHLISTVEPYKAHINAIQDRHKSWIAGDNKSTLAKDAVFEGVGMLWTIEDGYNLWEDQKAEAKQKKLDAPDESDISKAWHIIERDQKPAFTKRRCELYLKTTKLDDISDSEGMFNSLITYAAQVGLMLAWATLHELCAKEDTTPTKIALALSNAINANLTTGPNATRTRRKILMKKSKEAGFKPLNMLPRLQPIFAAHYRYLWLEIALHDKGKSKLDECIDTVKAEEILLKTRKTYLNLLIDERKKDRMKDTDIQDLLDPEKNKKALERAEAETIKEQSSAHKYWFGRSAEDARTLIKSTLTNEDNLEPSSTPKNSDQPISEDEGNEDSDIDETEEEIPSEGSPDEAAEDPTI